MRQKNNFQLMTKGAGNQLLFPLGNVRAVRPMPPASPPCRKSGRPVSGGCGINLTSGCLTFNCAVSVITLFAMAFLGGYYVLYTGILHSRYTYEVVFGPVVCVGYFWFGMVAVGAFRKGGISRLAGVLLFFVVMFLLANCIDLAMIKLDAWHFNSYTNLADLSFPPPLDRNVFGKPIQVPLFEIFGFNGSISWFIYFCNAAANALFRERFRFSSPEQSEAPGPAGPGLGMSRRSVSSLPACRFPLRTGHG